MADLADRAQLVLGRPVEIEWCARGGRYSVVGVRPLSLRPSFASGSWRLVTLLAPNEGTMAPLSVDALDHALGRESDADEPRVRRVYARAYRRMDGASTPLRAGTAPASLARAAARAARVAVDVAAPVAAARSFERGALARFAEQDAVDLRARTDEELIAAVRERQRLVIEALGLLDRGRLATLAVLAALEMAVGVLPRECIPALAAPRNTRTRRRLEDRLARLGRRIEQEAGELAARERLPSTLQRRWDDQRRAALDLRPLGIDVRTEAIGETDETLLRGVRAALLGEQEARERARRDAARRIVATARSKSLGRSREAMASSLLLLLRRVARSKGRVAEALSGGLLRLRRAAVEVGRRLVVNDVLERPTDALYLHLGELEDALSGEPGAYAARVRLRREDDQRWSRYEAPRRIDGRR